MSFATANSRYAAGECAGVRAEFSAYLDGAVTGVEMSAISGHLEACGECAAEFAIWRSVQTALGDLGPAQAPERLQAHLRAALASERVRGTHLGLSQRFALAWHNWLGGLAARAAGGFACALVLLGGAAGFLSGPLAVQANDENLAHLTGPRYLYSQVPPRPVDTGRGVPVLVEAKVGTDGRVYDYAIVAGPADPSVKLRVEENLLSSVFKPAMAFGVPVKGQVVITYSGVSVRG